LLWSRQIFSVVIVADDRRRFDAGADQEVNNDGLELGLSRFEIVASNEDSMLFGKLYGTGYKRILRTSVDVRAALQYGGHGEHG
jgi:hypothetical protein